MKNGRFLRITMILLCLCMMLSTVSCSQDSEDVEVPSGMQLATAEGALYRFFVPTHWSVNTAYGVSGGYYSLGTQSTVSVQSYPITEEMETALSAAVAAGKNATVAEGETAPTPAKLRADWFYENVLKPTVASLATGGMEAVAINCVPVLLDGVNAQQYHVSATVGEELLQFVHVVGERGGEFYVLSFVSADTIYANLKDDFATMRDAFRFFETPYVPKTPVKVIPEESAPEGMKLASNADVSYGFYVPNSWSVNENEEIFAATAPDGSSMSVIPYMPASGEEMSVLEYFEWNKTAMLKTSPNGYEEISTAEITLDGAAALRCEYNYTVGGVTYRYVQVITAWRGMFYNLTYTALPENFETNLADVQSILDAFDLR